jgi:hypothetical protein
MYGIGEIEGNKMSQSIAMGGTGIAFSQPGTLNSLNPASYYSIDSLAFLFNFGIQSKQSIYSSHGIMQSNHDFNFNSLALGFRITKWWANSMGIAPFSSVGYKISTNKSIEGTNETFEALIEGTGGMNRLYWGNSLKIRNNLYLGVNISYLFGQIIQLEKATSSLFNSTIATEDKIDIRNMYFDFGIQYTFLKRKGWVGTIGGIFSNKTNLKLEHNLGAVNNSSDTLYNNKTGKGNYSLPTMIGFGTAFEIQKKLTITTDYKLELWGKSGNTGTNLHYVNSNEFRFGAEYQPKQTITASYVGRIYYRMGYFYKTSYLKIKGSQLLNYGFSFGLGLPISRTNINLAYVYGSNGAYKNSGVINQKYHLIALTINLSDIWFVKYKYD